MQVPFIVSVLFTLVSITTIFLLFQASAYNKKVLLVVSIIALVQGLLAFFNFYSVQPVALYKVPLVVAPSFFIVLCALVLKRCNGFIQSLSLRTLTLLHTIRIPVELILFTLFTHGAIPEIMTFEGRNFDILAGLSAPLVYYLAFIKKSIGPKTLLIWNILSLGLLINIIIHAVLSLEIPIQQFGFDQPNRAILYFPFNWLPSVVVPIVFFSHLAAIKQLRQFKALN